MKKSLLLILPLLLAVFVLPAKCVDYGQAELWVLIVGGAERPEQPILYQALWDTFYCYYTLTNMYDTPRNHITWLYSGGDRYEPEVDSINETSTKANVQSAITSWLSSKADANDIILIYFRCHGSGFNITSGEYPDDCFDVDGDEDWEHYNSATGWFGVDEKLLLYGGLVEPPEFYWDDELASDLNTLTYGNLIVFISGCYSGGFIDDLSASNRVVITSANETSSSYDDSDGDLLSEFDEVFFDALFGYNTTCDGTTFIIHEEVDADYDENGHISMQEAFRYAYEHDDNRWVIGHIINEFTGEPIDESPWFDCDGNGCPTYLNGDILDEDDLDSEPIYLYRLFTLIVWYSSGGWVMFPGTYEYIEGTVVVLMAWPFSGYHFIWWWVDGGIRYGEDHGSYNVLFIEMNSDHFVYACFGSGTGGGGGEPCPTLYAWNGNDYVDYGVIDIHNPSGEDVVREVAVQMEDVGLNKHKARFRLREGWEGLNFSESVIDQVKLYAVDNDGNRKLCPLISATHSSLGKVLRQLRKSDDYRVQMLLLETIDLTFTATYKDAKAFLFVIEGNNMLKP